MILFILGVQKVMEMYPGTECYFENYFYSWRQKGVDGTTKTEGSIDKFTVAFVSNCIFSFSLGP